MDTLLEELQGPEFMNMNSFNHGSATLRSKQDLANRFKVNHEFFQEPFLPTNPLQDPGDDSSPSSTGTSLEGDPADSGEIPNTIILKYINEILMEENLEAKPCMLQDCLALQAAEKSFYEVLGQKYPSSTDQLYPCFDQSIESPDGYFDGSSSVDSGNSYTITSADNLVESNWIYDQGESKSFSMQSSAIDSSGYAFLLPDSFSERQPVESHPHGNHEIIDLESSPSVSPKQTTDAAENADMNRRHTSPNGSSRRKNHQREDSDDLEEGRSNKHSVNYAGDSESLEMYDEVLLCPGGIRDSKSCALRDSSGNGASKKLQQNGDSGGSNGKPTRSKKQGNKGGEIVDFWGLLTQCAQAVSSSDQRTANELLKQIRQHCSQFGDGNQRLAHYFAEALEARLAGTRVSMHPIVSNGTSAIDILKAYKVYITACPFKRMSNFFANRTTMKLAQKAPRLHIIDFGILYGFQWPCLIQRLSERPGGAPKLRITGIELPQSGFRPTERVEETGRRLENYCKRFNVPFEYNVIAQKWETIKLEDLKIDRDELTVVNCLFRLKNIPDETVAMNNPRDTVLKLIKKINPDLFMHGVVNGTYNAPFFVTRFREALYHFSSLFDMFDVNLPLEDPERLRYEKEVVGKEAMNVVACEGLERIERPETYKQWQVRNLRAGFRQVPLDQELVQKVKKAVKSEFHKDFVVDVDGQWLLQGWKGRIIYALSCWEPA
ncbi:hypothetical protein ACB098_08G048300 [Castanea mollissima]